MKFLSFFETLEILIVYINFDMNVLFQIFIRILEYIKFHSRYHKGEVLKFLIFLLFKMLSIFCTVYIDKNTRFLAAIFLYYSNPGETKEIGDEDVLERRGNVWKKCRLYYLIRTPPPLAREGILSYPL